jgi:hypothetical protein
MSGPSSLGILHSTAKYRNFLHTLFEVDGGAESMIGDMGIEPDISGLFDTRTGKSIVKNSIFQYVLDNAEAKVIIPLGVCEDRSLKG